MHALRAKKVSSNDLTKIQTNEPHENCDRGKANAVSTNIQCSYSEIRIDLLTVIRHLLLALTQGYTPGARNLLRIFAVIHLSFHFRSVFAVILQAYRIR